MNISNKLLDYAIVYEDRRQVNSGKYEDKRIIIDEVKNRFKAEVENRTDMSVLVVYDWRKTLSGMVIILYAFES
ncbi:hypothetical protein [Cytobacillus firmus]|uniref:hypothetical protein n=1 Tax=Cytobacillus firmus TaxID=1399 RepID=UPI001C8DFEA2|nr:hypothetical protein [Cytobacillus firmus]MBX9975894.1 hypothetical protein [Cytobacillus firmus]